LKSNVFILFTNYIMFESALHLYFGPLGKQYCVYFLLLTIFYLIVLTIFLHLEIYYLYKNYSKLQMKDMITGFVLTSNIFLTYFVNRLLYTMCNKSLI
jgi:hypothetical protein